MKKLTGVLLVGLLATSLNALAEPGRFELINVEYPFVNRVYGFNG